MPAVTSAAGPRSRSQQFSGKFPTIQYEMLLLQVPSNYDPTTRQYTGVWDGTFQTAWSDNPAWVLWACLTNERWGVGRFLETSNVDKWMLYAAAQWFDELVPDGNGGFEPRLTFNGTIDSALEAERALAVIAGACQSVFYWASGAVNIVVDKPDDPVAGAVFLLLARQRAKPARREIAADQLPYRSDERFRRERAGDRHNVGITGRCDNAPRLEFAIIAGHDDVVSLPGFNQHLIIECDLSTGYKDQPAKHPPALEARVSDVDVRARDKIVIGLADAEARDWVFQPTTTTCIQEPAGPRRITSETATPVGAAIGPVWNEVTEGSERRMPSSMRACLLGS